MTTDAVSVKERGEYIQAAVNVDPTFRDDLTKGCVGGPGRFEGCDDAELTAALEVIANNGFEDDSVEVDDGFIARIGPYVFQCSALGFRDSYEVTDDEWEAFVATTIR